MWKGFIFLAFLVAQLLRSQRFQPKYSGGEWNLKLKTSWTVTLDNSLEVVPMKSVHIEVCGLSRQFFTRKTHSCWIHCEHHKLSNFIHLHFNAVVAQTSLHKLSTVRVWRQNLSYMFSKCTLEDEPKSQDIIQTGISALSLADCVLLEAIRGVVDVLKSLEKFQHCKRCGAILASDKQLYWI